MLGVWFIASFFYIMILGGEGLTFLKLHIPFFRSKGAWYIRELETKRLEVYFGSYNPDKNIGQPNKKDEPIIDRPFSHTARGDPVLFIKNGHLANFDPFKNISPMRAAGWFSQLLIQTWNAAYNAGKGASEKDKGTNLIILIALLIIGVVCIWTLVLTLGQDEILKGFVTQLETYKPFIDSAVQGMSRIE